MFDLIKRFSSESYLMCQAAVQFLHNLGRDPNLHEALMEQGLMNMLLRVASPSSVMNEEGGECARTGVRAGSDLNQNIEEDDGNSSMPIRRSLSNKIGDVNDKLTENDVYNIVKAIDLVSATSSCCDRIVSQRAVAIFSGILEHADDTSRLEMARSLASLAQSKSCRKVLVAQGAPHLVLKLSDTINLETQGQCTLALGYLSELTTVEDGAVSTVLNITDQVNHVFQQEKGFRNIHSLYL